MPQQSAPRGDPAEELRAVALRLFVETSYAGASLQQIADEAGYSKSSVLYHFASKEALLESILSPAVDRLGVLLRDSVGRITDERRREQFVVEFIDFLFEYRLQAHIIINQAQSLAGIPVIERSRAYIGALSASFDSAVPSVARRTRLGVGLAGAAYVLAAGIIELSSNDDLVEVRAALIDVVTELVIPPSHSPHDSPSLHAAAQTATHTATPHRLTH